MRIPLDSSSSSSTTTKEVIFPFDRIYAEQYDFLKRTYPVINSKDGGHCLLEMPNGASVCMISLCLSLERKLVYAMNPLPQMKRLKEEVELCYQVYRKEKEADGDDVKMEDAANNDDTNHTATANNETFLTLCLSSHDQDLLHESHRSCCSSNITTKRNISGIYENLQHLIDANHQNNNWCCKHHLIQSAMEQANIFIVQYTYLLDPKVSKMMSANLFSSGAAKEEEDVNMDTTDATAAAVVSSNTAAASTTTTTTTTTGNNNEDAAVSTNNNKQSDAVVVFDQAHNIDSICMNILSVTIHSTCLDQATRSLGRLSSEISRRKQMTNNTNGNNNNGSSSSSSSIPSLQDEYESLVDTPIDHGVFFRKENNKKEFSLYTNQSEDWEPVPGNIRRAEHFIGFLRKIIEYYKVQLRWLTTSPNAKVNNKNMIGSKKNGNTNANTNENSNETHRKESPLSFLHRLTNSTGLEAKALRFTYARLLSLLRTFQITSYPLLDSKSFASLLAVADLTSLLANHVTDHNSKFTIVTELSHMDSSSPSYHDEQENADMNNQKGGMLVRKDKVPTLQFVCLDASLALSPVLERFRTVVLTSTAMSPLEFYPKLLQFTPTLMHAFPLSFSQNCVYPTIIARGSDQIAMSTKTSDRTSLSVVRNYGSLLVELCSIIPDGVVVYFPSYSYMESLLQEWDAMGILRQLTKYKLVFLEEVYDLNQTTLTLDNYRLACDTGRGGIFFAVARGRVSECSQMLDYHYGRATIVFGLPILYSQSQIVQARVDYCQTYLEIPSAEYWNFDAMRQASKCLANTLRSPLTDYSIFVLADIRYNHKEKRSKLPGWMVAGDSQQQLEPMSTDHAVQQIRSVLRHMGQPILQPVVRSLLWTREDILLRNRKTTTDTTMSSAAVVVAEPVKSEGP